MLRITGSQAVGFANNASDLDLYAVVDANVDPLPILQYLNEVRVEVRYFSRGVVAQWWPLIEELLTGFPLTTSNEHSRLHYALEHVGRLCCGFDIIDPDPNIAALLPSEFLISRTMSRYWSLMAARNRMAVTICEAFPRYFPDRFSRWRLQDSIICGLESQAAFRGEYYLKPKWLGNKLARLGYEDGLSTLRTVLRSSTDTDQMASLVVMNAADDPWYSEICDLVPSLLVRSDVEVVDVLGCPVMTRWRHRCFDGSDFNGAIEPDALVWSASEGSMRPFMAGAFAAGMLWLSGAVG